MPLTAPHPLLTGAAYVPLDPLFPNERLLMIAADAGLEGTMLGPALFSGRVAGAWAAKEAGWGTGFVT